MIESRRIIEASLHLLEPYTIPDDCPYFSEEQRELSKLGPTQTQTYPL